MFAAGIWTLEYGPMIIVGNHSGYQRPAFCGKGLKCNNTLISLEVRYDFQYGSPIKFQMYGAEFEMALVCL